MEDSVKPSERRASARYALHLIGTGALLHRNLPGSDQFEVRCLNISLGGLMVTMDPDVRYGDVIRVVLIQPADFSTITFECTIQWLRRNTGNVMGRYFAGLSFRQASVDTVQILLDHAMKTSPIPEP